MLRKWALTYSRWLEELDRWISYTYWLQLLAAFYMTWEVVMRYFFRSPHEWFDEIMIHMCVLAIFFGCANATWLGKHVTLELVYVHLRGKWRQGADIVHYIAVVVLSVMMVIFSIRWGIFVDSQGAGYQTVIGTPWSLLTYIMGLGFALNGIYGFGLLLRACADIGYEKSGKERATAG